MIYIDKYACFSALKDANPLVKILFGGLSLIVCVGSVSLVSYATVFAAMFYATVFKAKIPFRYYVKLMVYPLGFLAFGVVGVMFDVAIQDTPPECIRYFNYGNYCIYVSKTGFATAINLASKAIAAVSCLYFIILTTPFRDIIHFLRIVRCPEIIVTLSVLIYQFIFLLLDIADTKLKSQLCRGGYRSFTGFAKTFAMLWGSIFIQAMLKSGNTFKSMQARGFDGHFKFMPLKLRISVSEMIALSLFLACVIAANFIK